MPAPLPPSAGWALGGRVGRAPPQGPEVSSSKGGLRPCGLLGLKNHEQALPPSPESFSSKGSVVGS